MPTIQYKVKSDYTRKTTELLDMLNDKDTRIKVNTIIADAIQPFVPMKSGRLRRSRYVGVKLISWGRGLEYAHYQHEGVVYAPNYPIVQGGAIVGWYSPKGKGTKHPTDRELGAHGMWTPEDHRATFMKWNFGYTTIGTRHHWEKAYDWELKRKTNLEITRMLKKMCKERGLSS